MASNEVIRNNKIAQKKYEPIPNNVDRDHSTRLEQNPTEL